MGRCRKKRCCRRLSGRRIFKPVGRQMHSLQLVELELDEFEAVRLCDFEDKNQIEAADAMEVSRATVQRLLKSGRYKIIDALLNTKGIKIKDMEEENENLYADRG